VCKNVVLMKKFKMVDYIFIFLYSRLRWCTFTNYRYYVSWFCLALGLHFLRPLYYSRLCSWLESAYKTSHMFVPMPLTWSPIAQSSLVLLWFGLPKEKGSSSTIHIPQTLSTLFHSSCCSLFLYLTGWVRYAALESLLSFCYKAYVNRYSGHDSAMFGRSTVLSVGIFYSFPGTCVWVLRYPESSWVLPYKLFWTSHLSLWFDCV
jgi:hypothetical protein